MKEALSMNYADQYIDLYKRLEAIIRNEYGLRADEPIKEYLKQPEKHKHKRAEINYCAEVRNLLQHKEKLGNDYPVQPTQPMLDFIAGLIADLEERPRCREIAIKTNIYTQTMDQSVSEAIDYMRKENYTNIPLMENGVVVGVFGENTLFNYLADDRIVDIDELTFQDMNRYTGIENRGDEVYRFHRFDAYVDELEAMFEKEHRQARRLSMVFLTQNGKKEEKLLGIITPWDILSKLQLNTSQRQHSGVK